ncbi:MAG: FeoA domain-containing protein [Nitrospiraceae bacterium]|nr:MAG: FeoA domain-containing protein [Nitrospiraceae bacterium]
MTLTDRAEEILETLWIEVVEKEKEACDISILKDDSTITDLKDAGFVRVRDNLLSLTAKGRDEARSCIRRHRLAERLFVDVLAVRGREVHETSCKFEHLLHKGLDENICTLLGHPRTCPHGKPIPEGPCCREKAKMPGRVNIPLTELEKNRKARVTYLQTDNRQKLQKIIAMGALPNTEITLLQKFPSYVFRIARSQFAVDEDLASCIYVTRDTL